MNLSFEALMAQAEQNTKEAEDRLCRIRKEERAAQERAREQARREEEMEKKDELRKREHREQQLKKEQLSKQRAERAAKVAEIRQRREEEEARRVEVDRRARSAKYLSGGLASLLPPPVSRGKSKASATTGRRSNPERKMGSKMRVEPNVSLASHLTLTPVSQRRRDTRTVAQLMDERIEAMQGRGTNKSAAFLALEASLRPQSSEVSKKSTEEKKAVEARRIAEAKRAAEARRGSKPSPWAPKPGSEANRREKLQGSSSPLPPPPSLPPKDRRKHTSSNNGLIPVNQRPRDKRSVADLMDERRQRRLDQDDQGGEVRQGKGVNQDRAGPIRPGQFRQSQLTLPQRSTSSQSRSPFPPRPSSSQSRTSSFPNRQRPSYPSRHADRYDDEEEEEEDGFIDDEEDDPTELSKVIGQLFGKRYQQSHYDDSDDDMEATAADVHQEEAFSSRLARKEDQEEDRLEQERLRERERRLKRRRL
ncbi:SPT2 chromatin protein-domain-containing protein [Piptocephalis cylindrospora]|uniref:SPT2 chromatin protein-domain-containing protein n=1 Tax=Piptocephalis cylindrospora TaxID=1907219 RepID=A0A4P9Y746_9FUNG|nr:SPT2 chromatin protein-domain-containing protein [Piptocephalis cylindrospora]|eukprot:RKP14534.1 SPT2 chromatin protein-domain-containing protein [Piptocephalis cylindrospora]